jgi:hypothetical protein
LVGLAVGVKPGVIVFVGVTVNVGVGVGVGIQLTIKVVSHKSASIILIKTSGAFAN